MSRDLINAAIREWRRRRLAGLVARHALPALRAYARGDAATYVNLMNRLGHRGGGTAVYLACVGWLLTAHQLSGGPPGHPPTEECDGRHQYRMVAGHTSDPDDDDAFQPVDNPDELTDPHDRAMIFASRLYVAVLNQDTVLARALFDARAAEGREALRDAVTAVAEVTRQLLSRGDAQ